MARDQPRARTRVDAAKRALNFVRAIAGLPTLDDNISVRMFCKAARNRRVATVRQSPHMPVAFMHCIVTSWGGGGIWWQRQIALMIIIAVCSIGRGDEVCACVRVGIAWVLQDGTLVIDNSFRPGHHCRDKNCRQPSCVRGFLLLFTTRKNSQSAPSWIPIGSASAIKMLSDHLRWLDQLPSRHRHLFLPRRPIRRKGVRQYAAPSDPNAKIHVDSFRKLLRQSIVECCGVSPAVAKEYGTHSPRLGAIQMLRRHGVPAELRQQMGQWMSQKVALRYLQLTPGEQFDILQTL